MPINFRPQACSPPRRLGSRERGHCRGLRWTAGGWSRISLHLAAPPLHLAAPSSLWEAWGRGLFTPCTHRRPGQSVERGALRYSSCGPIGAHRAAPPPKLARGKRGSGWAGCGRTEPPAISPAAAAAAWHAGRALTLPLWAARGRAQGRRPGASNSGALTGQAADLPPLPRV